MLALAGFLIVGLFFAAFAQSFQSIVVSRTQLKLQAFSYAYYCLALAFVMWGIVSAMGNSSLLQASVIVGDSLLLLGTIFLLSIMVERNRALWISLAIAVSLALIVIRIASFQPTAFIDNGILIFNTQTPVAIVLSAIIALVWLPINTYVARQVVQQIGRAGLSRIYTFVYCASTLAALIFLSARRPLTVILSFVTLAICFVMLIASNLLVKTLKEQHGTKQPTD